MNSSSSEMCDPIIVAKILQGFCHSNLNGSQVQSRVCEMETKSPGGPSKVFETKGQVNSLQEVHESDRTAINSRISKFTTDESPGKAFFQILLLLKYLK